MFTKIKEKIQEYTTIIIHRHTNPDGDALGSQIGLKAALQENFPDKKIYAVGDEAKRYAFMDGSVMDEIADEEYQNAFAIILDCGSAHLISDERYKTAKETARFDHHIYSEKIADYEVVDTSFESCCGLITGFLLESDISLSPVSAKALFTGMVTDSGRFRYDSTNEQTFRMAAALRAQNFDINSVYAPLYADDFKFVKLRAQFTLKIQFAENGVAYIYTTKEELPTYDADTFTISRGMVNTMADLRGVDTWVNFTETEGGVLCEIRSAKYTVNPIAVKYGGGGHAKACGATLKDKEEAFALLADLIALGKA